MRPLISALAMIFALPALAWAQAGEPPVERLETLWQFDTGG
jgi:hypothetical protein